MDATLQKLIEGFRSDEIRFCSRCGKMLEDPASLTRGVGPICARQQAPVFAKTIPANYASAIAELNTIEKSQLPEGIVRQVFDRIQVILFNRAEKAYETSMNFEASGQDLRDVCKAIDWILSFSGTSEQKPNFIRVVKHLGFVGLAAILEGKASRGEAKIWFENNFIFLEGSSNKAGWNQLRQLRGTTTPRHRGDKTPYKVPARHFSEFKTIVMEFWPLFTGDIDQIEQQCKTVSESQVPQVSSAFVQTKAEAKIVVYSTTFTANFPWRGQEVIEKLKQAVPAKYRSYDNTKTWTFQILYLETITNILQTVYQVNITRM